MTPMQDWPAMTDEPLKAISLFSGYEGFGLGLKMAGINLEVLLYVEIDEYATNIIKARQRDGILDPGEVHDDIKSLDGRKYRGIVDIIFGGFPCQTHSVAGNRAGEADERNLWPDTMRTIRDVGPRFVFLENVPGINVSPGDGRPAYGGTVVGQLSELGYCVEWDVVSAADAGAPHLRKRWWVVAHA